VEHYLVLHVIHLREDIVDWRKVNQLAAIAAQCEKITFQQFKEKP
jgi:hypothetical protein